MSNVKADVCVIGAGFTGLSAAMHLARAGRSVVVLERGRIADGASGRNGGQASVGMRLKQDALEKMVGAEDARRLWDVALDAWHHLHGLIAEGLDCEFAPGVFRLEHRLDAVPAAHRHAAMLRARYGFDALEPLGPDDVRRLIATDAYQGGVYDRVSGHLHPLKLAFGLARLARDAGAQLFENSAATSVDETGGVSMVRTPAASVEAKRVIYAGNGMMTGLDGGIDGHVMPIRNYVLATEQLAPEVAEGLIARGAAVSDTRFVVYYFRVSRDRRLIFGGGETYSYRDPRDVKTFVRSHMLRVFPQVAKARIDYAWGGTLGITRSRMPFVRRVGDRGLAAAGFSGRGVVLAPYFGKVLADAVRDRMETFDLLARLPMSRFPGGVPLRAPMLLAGMSAYKIRDRLGI
ncbi:FAD-binding oxidoreductase [Hansschlegelia quercus]|uniref:FAD-binding oxidoreductase n=2 Tax=Hansschlegelia quercus TaxID=2528245 RepID=A0A4Q9GME2_9HYPH|nr:FAD-binding oxidoreductase [Hansschlegelia quercus]